MAARFFCETFEQEHDELFVAIRVRAVRIRYDHTGGMDGRGVGADKRALSKSIAGGDAVRGTVAGGSRSQFSTPDLPAVIGGLAGDESGHRHEGEIRIVAAGRVPGRPGT